MTTIDKIRAEIERLIRMNQTKNGFPAGTICAIRIEAYERLLAFFDTLPDEPSCPISDGWKPTEAQMNGLAHAINLDVYDAERYGLDSLYNDLKKLM